MAAGDAFVHLFEWTHCDVLTGGRAGAACAGTSVTVSSSGAVQLTVPAKSATAIHTGSKL